MTLLPSRATIKHLLLLIGAASAAAVLVWLAPAASAQATAAPPHRLHCVLIQGRLYLGSPGAGSNPKFVTCAIHFDQVLPRSDGVIVVLHHAPQRSTYSILKTHFFTPPAGRYRIRWLHHPGSAKIGCVLSHGRLYLGSSAPAGPRRHVTCSVAFYQLEPAADGVTAVLRHRHRTTTYSVVLRRLPHRPTAYLRIRWLA